MPCYDDFGQQMKRKRCAKIRDVEINNLKKTGQSGNCGRAENYETGGKGKAICLAALTTDNLKKTIRWGRARLHRSDFSPTRGGGKEQRCHIRRGNAESRALLEIRVRQRMC